MLRRFALVTAGLLCVLAGELLISASVRADAPEWKYGLNFRVRKAGQPDFGKDTLRIGCEFYLDKTNNQGIYISETGSLGSVVAPPLLASGASETKAPRWLHGMELKVRKAGEADFSTTTKKYGLECFRDENNGLLVYVCETGSVAVLKGGAASPAAEKVKSPTWLFGLELKARKGSETSFTDKTATYGLECFRDENNGNLIYISENGSIAALPPSASPIPKEPRGPRGLHGLSFQVRPASQPDFTNDTPRFGVEIFKDENTGNLIYISEKGALAVVPGGQPSSGKTVAPKWLQGILLKVRKGGEDDFNKDTKQYGVEVFRDENTGNLVYISETAAIGVAPK